jgi:hypothetical protein
MPELAPLGVVQLELELLPTEPLLLLLLLLPVLEMGPELDALLLPELELLDPASSDVLAPELPASSPGPPSVEDGDRCPPQATATIVPTRTAHRSRTLMSRHGACSVPPVDHRPRGDRSLRACHVAPTRDRAVVCARVRRFMMALAGGARSRRMSSK